MTKTISTALFCLAFGVVSCTTAPTNNASNEARKPANESALSSVKDTAATLGEVFLKGSIDGKSLFMVVGVKDGIDVSKDILESAVTEKDLKDLAGEFYNKEHKDDAYDRYRDSFKAAQDVLPDLFKGPWKTLKKIPKAYKVNFERGEAALYNTKNPIAGALKYSGWAVWANVEGARYLIIEAPVQAVMATVAVPLVVAVPTVEQVLAVSMRGSMIALKLSLEVAALAAVNSYAFVTSSTATVLTALAGGGLAVYRGGRYVFYGLPHRFGYPVAVELVTDRNAGEQEGIAQKIMDLFEKDGIQKNIHLKGVIGKFKSKLSMIGDNDDGSQIEMGQILVSVEKAQVVINVEFKSAYIKALMKDRGMSKKEAKSRLNEEAIALTEIIQDKISPAK